MDQEERAALQRQLGRLMRSARREVLGLSLHALELHIRVLDHQTRLNKGTLSRIEHALHLPRFRHLELIYLGLEPAFVDQGTAQRFRAIVHQLYPQLPPTSILASSPSRLDGTSDYYLRLWQTLRLPLEVTPESAKCELPFLRTFVYQGAANIAAARCNFLISRLEAAFGSANGRHPPQADAAEALSLLYSGLAIALYEELPVREYRQVIKAVEKSLAHSDLRGISEERNQELVAAAYLPLGIIAGILEEAIETRRGRAAHGYERLYQECMRVAGLPAEATSCTILEVASGSDELSVALMGEINLQTARFYRAHDIRGAEAEYRAAEDLIASHPGLPLVPIHLHDSRARICMRGLHDLSEAEEHLKKADECQPSSPLTNAMLDLTRCELELNSPHRDIRENARQKLRTLIPHLPTPRRRARARATAQRYGIQLAQTF